MVSRMAQSVHPVTGSFVMEGKLRRFVIIGPKGVGKSCLILRFSEDLFEEHYTPTIEDLFLVSTTVDGTAFNCEILDTAGQDEVSSYGPRLTIGIHGYMIMFSVRDRGSFELVRHVNRNLLMSLGGLQGQAVPRLLIGGQIDATDERVVSTEEAKKLARELRMPYLETSALTGEGIQETIHSMVQEVEQQHSKNPKQDKDKKKCIIS